MMTIILLFVASVIGTVLMLVDCGVIIGTIGEIIALFSFALLPVATFQVLIVRVSREIDYNHTLYKKTVLEYRLKHIDKEGVVNGQIYKDIMMFNRSLSTTKKNVNNIFFNWFCNKLVAEKIDYIQIEGIELPLNY